jgi:putative addiction module component (TIGR02574 family)
MVPKKGTSSASSLILCQRVHADWCPLLPNQALQLTVKGRPPINRGNVWRSRPASGRGIKVHSARQLSAKPLAGAGSLQLAPGQSVGEISGMSVLSAERIRELTPAERIELIELLWESFVDDPTTLPVTAEQKAELRRRLAEHEALV